MKAREINYSDFPKVEIIEDPTLKILQSGKKVTVRTLSTYLKISMNSARKRLIKIEKSGLCKSKLIIIKDVRNKLSPARIYYI